MQRHIANCLRQPLYQPGGQSVLKSRNSRAVSVGMVRENNPYRLSPFATPSHYEILLRPDLDAFTFSGKVDIKLTITEATSTIELNANDLSISHASIDVSSGGRIPLTYELDTELEFLRLSSDTALEQGETWLHIEFSGELKDDLAGFYRSSYVDENGETRYLATTQFESTDARKAFPCFDEPDLKATYRVALEGRNEDVILSNYPEERTEDLGNGYRRVTFETTMRMSTYLLCFVVGPLAISETTTDSGVPLRIVTTPEKAHLTDFAMKVGHHALSFFTEWFQIPYPAPKLDMIGIPDFAMGAMENLGAITYRESLLVVDESNASKAELERAADVICHEIAHMWFGDLVTMKWWNGIWLNEAFATYMELLACDAFRSEWRRWDSFSLVRTSAMDTDSLPSTRSIECPVLAPADARDMFDLLTYEKGGAILRMLECYLGTDRMRTGVRHYLEKHRLSNAETSDLWDAIEEATGEPVREIMDTWVYQGGHPLITASEEDGRLLLRQLPFRLLGRDDDPIGSIGSSWVVPIHIRNAQGEHKLLLRSDSLLTEISTEGGITLNAGGVGVYRSRYEGALLASVGERYHDLSVLERYGLMSDAWASVLAETAPLGDYLELVRASTGERDPNVLRSILGAAAILNRVSSPASKQAVATFVRSIFGPILDDLGTEPLEDDTQDEAIVRAIAFEAMGNIVNEKEVIDAATEQFRLDMSGVKVLSPDIATAVLAVIAAHGDDTEFAFLLDRSRNPRDPQDRLRNLYSLTQFRSERLIARVAAMTLDEIRIQDAFIVLARLVANPAMGHVATRFIFANWEAILERFPPHSYETVLSGVSTLISDDSYLLAGEVFRFVEEHPLPTGVRMMAQNLERYRLNLRLRENYGHRIAELL